MSLAIFKKQENKDNQVNICPTLKECIKLKGRIDEMIFQMLKIVIATLTPRAN
jgi:hypothetical protein